MHYDPIKDSLASVIKRVPAFRIIFYNLLNILFLRSWYVRRELRKIRKALGNKKLSIYDAGTGYGQYSYYMSQNLQPCEILSVDIKEEWIKDTREFFQNQNIDNVKFNVEDLTEISHQNKFDLITCIDVMEHIEKDVKVFENFYNALKKDGFVIINSPSIYGGSDVHDDADESFIGEHFRDGYSIEDLKAKLEPFGFSIYSYKYTYGTWGDISWRLAIKYPMTMLNASKIFFLVLPFYYILTFWLSLIFMFLDYTSDNKVGTGINLIAQKK